ncbi:MAG: FtsX-like permease family protein [Burkholderiales bacterium]|nr:FtsX-like permease family protein [Burkholderiales bacterium]
MEIRPILSALLRNKTAPLLVALQVAISLAILVNALHIVQLRIADAQRPSGMLDESVVFELDMSAIKQHNVNEKLALQQSARLALRNLPGVLSVATTNQMPMSRSGHQSTIYKEMHQTRPIASVAQYTTADSLVDTFGLKVIAGRDFVSADVVDNDENNDTEPKNVMVTQAVTQLLYPDLPASEVIGKRIIFDPEDKLEVRIIGVVERLQTVAAKPGVAGEYSVIKPVRFARSNLRFAVRTAPGQRDRVMKDAEVAMRKISNEPFVITTKSSEKDREKRYSNDKALAGMLLVISGLLLLITASGIVGMSSLWLAQRRKQIGVRRALGARKRDILRYFLLENALITCSGIAIGFVLALGLNQLLVSQLSMQKLPLPYLATGASMFLLLGLASVFGPALRATAISPALATRSV